MLIEVFEAEKSRLRWYYLVAYGAPLLVVAISCIIDPLSYGTDRYCWLRADNYFIFSFVGPVILVILVSSGSGGSSLSESQDVSKPRPVPGNNVLSYIESR